MIGLERRSRDDQEKGSYKRREKSVNVRSVRTGEVWREVGERGGKDKQ